MTDRASDRASSAAEGGKDKIIGEILASRYQIESRLGEGAMGAVYKAKHVKVGRAFAVKVLHSKLLEDTKVAQRFEREAELAGRLRHPNVVGVVDVGETADGLRYMVMDFASGPDLAALLSEAPMPGPRVINIARQLLEGLYHAHEAGLIHRDFKPENVIVEKDAHGVEMPRIVDFGIAILREGGDSTGGQGRLTTNGLVLGTPHYMAPEQAVADPIDHRIDLFALGIVIYEMLSGKLPFDGTGAEVARANLLLDPPLIAQRVPYLEVDPLLEAFARRLMAKKRDARPATAKAARELLDLIEKDRAAAATALNVPLTIAREPATTAPSTPQPRRNELSSDTFPPPYEASDAVPAVDKIDEKFVQTMPIGVFDEEPEEPTRQRRPLALFAGVGVALLAGIVIVVAMRGGKEPTKPAPPVDPTPNVVVVTPDAAIEVVATPDAGEAIAVAPDASVEVIPDPKPPKTQVKVPKTNAKPDPKPTPNVVKVDPPKVDPPKVDPPKVDPPKVDPPKQTGPLDGNATAKIYASVGNKLKALGADADQEMWNSYRRIQLMTALREEREGNLAKLQEIQRALAKLQSQIAAIEKAKK